MNFSRSSTETVVSGRYGTGHSGQLCESSLRNMTKLARSLISLPSLYSVGRLQVNMTPLGSGLAVKFLMGCGAASSGARGSPFLPHDEPRTIKIDAKMTSRFIYTLS